MKYAVTVVSPPGYIFSLSFQDVAETIHYGLLALGHDSLLTTEGMIAGRRHIVLGSNLLPGHPIPLAPDAILYNLEQIRDNHVWLNPDFVNILRRHAVWDYSADNARALADLGVRVERLLPIGYTDQLTRIPRAREQDIDVLFIGSANDRRNAAMDSMRRAGLNAVQVFGLFGAERDALIARAKILLNTHFFDAKVLEVVRISYYLANRCVVLSERGANAADDAAFEAGVAFADYGDLTRRAIELCGDAPERERLAEAGLELMRGRRIEPLLAAALGEAGPELHARAPD